MSINLRRSFSFAILTACLMLGIGCNNSRSKITEKQLQEIKGNNVAVTPGSGPFAGVKFIFYNQVMGLGLSSTGEASNGDSTFEVRKTNSSSEKILDIVAKQEPLQKILSESATSTGRTTYSYKINGQTVDEVRCAVTQTTDYCTRYLAIDPNRSLVITDHTNYRYSADKFDNLKNLPYFQLFNFELQSVEPASGEWSFYEQKDLPFTFYYPKITGISVGLSSSGNKLFKESYSQFSVDVFLPRSSTKINLDNPPNPLMHIESIVGDGKKFLTEQQVSVKSTTSTQEIVGGVPVTSFCYEQNKSSVCEYYFIRPGQDTVRVIEYSNQKLYKTLQFKHYYPYEPLQILEDNIISLK